MEEIKIFFTSDLYTYILSAIIFVIFILYIINCIKLYRMRKDYKTFLNRLGNGTNVEDMLKQYMDKVEEVNCKNQELMVYCNKLDKDMVSCIQKVGIVRYSAFKDMGSDLSFALALLDEENSGVVLNGIYSREMSNIYAKPVENGKSNYTLSDEEKVALQKAVEDKRIYGVE